MTIKTFMNAAILTYAADTPKTDDPRVPSGAYTFKAVLASQGLVEKYYTRWDGSSLRSFAAGINDGGIPLLANHDTWTLPVGWAYAAEVNGQPIDHNGTGDGATLVIHAYIQHDTGHDDLINKIKGGTIRALSIGATTKSNSGYICSVCHGDYTNGEKCNHIAGETYDNVMCYIWIANAVPLEASLVWRGADDKALVLSKSGSPSVIEKKGLSMNWDAIIRHAQDRGLRHLALKMQAEQVDDVRITALVDTIKELVDTIEELGDKMVTLESSAADGAAYRSDLINQAVVSRRRAQGAGFSAALETPYRNALAQYAINDLKAEIAAYEAAVASTFTAGRPSQGVSAVNKTENKNFAIYKDGR